MAEAKELWIERGPLSASLVDAGKLLEEEFSVMILLNSILESIELQLRIF